MTIKSTLDKEDNLNDPRKPAEPNTDRLDKTGLDEWNQRLDNNLEAEHAGDPQADDNAKQYSEHIADEAKPAPLLPPSAPRGAKDGLDNTGTQGYDSLSDDSFTGSSGKENDQDYQSHTGSSSSDFDDIDPHEKQ
jgi:hypothetical protein